MWIYEKKLEYPVKIKNPNPRLAKIILEQYGGPDPGLKLWYDVKCFICWVCPYVMHK